MHVEISRLCTVEVHIEISRLCIISRLCTKEMSVTIPAVHVKKSRLSTIEISGRRKDRLCIIEQNETFVEVKKTGYVYYNFWQKKNRLSIID